MTSLGTFSLPNQSPYVRPAVVEEGVGMNLLPVKVESRCLNVTKHSAPPRPPIAITRNQRSEKAREPDSPVVG
jgi:hypothetical protein